MTASNPLGPVTFVADSTSSYTSSGSAWTGNVSQAMPAGIAAGDLLIILVAVNGTATWPSPPSGWTSLYTTAGMIGVYYKIAVGGDATATFTVANAGGEGSAMCLAYRGAAVDTTGTVGTTVANSVTASQNSSLLLGFWGCRSLDMSTTPPSGMSARTLVASGGLTTQAYTFVQSIGAGATGTRTISTGTTVASLLIAIKPG